MIRDGGFDEESLAEALKFYHAQLTETLVRLGHGVDLYPWEEFLGDFRECFVFGVCMGVFHAQVRMNKVTWTARPDRPKKWICVHVCVWSAQLLGKKVEQYLLIVMASWLAHWLPCLLLGIPSSRGHLPFFWLNF